MVQAMQTKKNDASAGKLFSLQLDSKLLSFDFPLDTPQ